MNPQYRDSVRLEAENRALKSRIRELEGHVTEQDKRLKNLERRISLHAKSGLPSQYQLGIELQMQMDRYRNKPKASVAILIVQLGPSFSIIRNSLKTSVSEWVLYQVGCRLSDLCSGKDQVYHTRETEFILVLPDRTIASLSDFLRQLFVTMDEPHIFSGFNLTIPSIIGAAVYPQHGRNKSTLLQNADIALGNALETGKRFRVFHARLKDLVVQKMELQTQIVKAIESSSIEKVTSQFSMHYQPKLLVERDPEHSDRLLVKAIDAEALIRWNHPDLGVVSPSRFIPLAEETGLIMPLGKWTIFRVCEVMESWKAKGMGKVGLSVNLSARQFRSDEFFDILSRQLQSRPIDARSMTLELTETSLFENPEAAARCLGGFKSLGVRISVDDFGTGYSSLSHLHDFPIDEIKIDRLFIEHFDKNHQDRAIVRSLIHLTTDMGMDLVVEGVEKRDTMETLLDLGCNRFQGYFFSPPMPIEGFEVFYRNLEKAHFVLHRPGVS